MCICMCGCGYVDVDVWMYACICMCGCGCVDVWMCSVFRMVALLFFIFLKFEFKSLLLSFQEKKSALLSKDNSKEARIAIANQFQTLCLLTYKKHPEIFAQATEELKSLKVKPTTEPSVGGPFIQAIVRTFGWKLAKDLSLLKARLSN